MIPIRHIYKYALILLMLCTATACTDDPIYGDGGAGDPNAVKFSASVSRATSELTRSGENPLYEPLVLTSADGGAPLYLHTFRTNKMGYRPGVDSNSPRTRGMQVETVEDLVKFHKDFMVHSTIRNSGEEYIEWSPTRPLTQGSDVWVTSGTRHWRGEEELTFQAIAPSSEFPRLEKSLHTTGGDIYFSYTALKGNGNNDAEQQKDLLMAASSCNKPGSVQGRAPLKFHHALSAIKFAVRDVMGGEVVKIQIANVFGTADCVYTANADGTDGTFFWSGHSGRQTYGQLFNHKIEDRVVDPADGSDDIILNQSMPEKTFMLIPQQIPDDAEIVVTLKYAATASMDATTRTLRARIKDNAVTSWEAGHEYIYTISTSKDNWVYVLEAWGNHLAEGEHHGSKKDGYNVLGDQIYVYSPSKKNHDTYGDTAYFAVRSFRYRANNHDIEEDLPWRATHGDAIQYRVTTPTHTPVDGRNIKADQWITDLHPDKKHGKGDHSAKGEIHDLVFAAHHILTNWPGDIWMQDEPPYSNNSQSTPWDLSTCGGQNPRTTANCYVIDREGYYCFPLYYGNAWSGGRHNKESYIISNSERMKDYLDHDIADYKIPEETCVKAKVLWSDVYHAVSDVSIEMIDNIKMVRFKANKYDLQQGNVVIGVFDANDNIVWSWHIWITEHWLEPRVGLPHAFSQKSKAFDYKASQEKRRMLGDVLVHVDDDEVDVKRYMAPYNLGWCDPKNVDYLRRPEYMNFVQYRPDGSTPTGLTRQLPIIQDGERIEYKYGNTTYYQFGRKDPIIGFVNHDNDVKRSFGPKEYRYKTEKQTVSVGWATRHPFELYCTGDAPDWCDKPKYTFWNNAPNSATSNYTVKTVYDPCPPGYCVPPSVILRFIGKCNPYVDEKGNNKPAEYFNSRSNNHPPFDYFNGERLNQFTFRIKRTATLGDDFDDKDAIWISSTGNRWYTNSRPNLAMGGDNFNWQLAYLWSCTVHTGSGSSHMAWGIALGQDTKNVINDKDEIDPSDNNYVITPYFDGRRSMARPVRAVREEVPQ